MTSIMRSARAERPGRNDPCSCNSGKKYKKCCLAKDEAAARASSLAAAPPTRAVVPHTFTHARRSPSVNLVEGIAYSPGVVRVAALTRDAFVEAYNLTPYCAARLSEDPRLLGDPELRAAIERHLRDDWTFAKLAARTTEEIEEQLGAYGVAYARADFLALAEARTTAWSISDVWRARDPITCRGKELDFLGMAACVLWERLLPERPSAEMLDDLMQEGYLHIEDNRVSEGCDRWWRVWNLLRGRLPPSVRTVAEAERMFPGRQVLSNWFQDLELHFGDEAARDPERARRGLQLVDAWLEQFTEEGEALTRPMVGARGWFLLALGESARGEAVLESVIERWPDAAQGYLDLADQYAHTFTWRSRLPHDLPRARRLLELGAARVTDDPGGLRERLRDLPSS